MNEQRTATEVITKINDSLSPRETVRFCGRNELGDAEILNHLYGGRILYDHGERIWHLWNGQHWERDKQNVVENLACAEVSIQYDTTAVALRQQQVKEGKIDGGDAVADMLSGRASTVRTLRRTKNILGLAQTLPELKTKGDGWDTHPYLLACPNGTLDLRTGEFRDGRPGDYIRTACPTHWEGLDTPAPRWERFLQEIFDGDAELIGFVQRLLGYGVSGLAVEHVFPVLHGRGRNGKDTLLEALKYVLGDAASPVGKEVMLANGRINQGQANPHLYSLRGLRLAWVSEINEDSRLDASRVKFISGGGSIVARPLYKESMTFAPTHLLMLITNYKPRANASDYALWKRLLLIPFTQSFVDGPAREDEHKCDPHLAEKLKKEASGILAWLARGFLQWQEDGLRVPQTVRAATETYRTDEDALTEFLDEKCIVNKSARVKVGDLRTEYQAWAYKNDVTPLGKVALGNALDEWFYQSGLELGKVKGTGGVRLYQGIRLREPAVDDLADIIRANRQKG